MERHYLGAVLFTVQTSQQHITLSRRCPGEKTTAPAVRRRTEVYLRTGERVTGLRLPGSSSRVHQPSGPLSDPSNTPPLILQSPWPQGLDKSGVHIMGLLLEKRVPYFAIHHLNLVSLCRGLHCCCGIAPRQPDSCQMSGLHANETPC